MTGCLTRLHRYLHRVWSVSSVTGTLIPSSPLGIPYLILVRKLSRSPFGCNATAAETLLLWQSPPAMTMVDLLVAALTEMTRLLVNVAVYRKVLCLIL